MRIVVATGASGGHIFPAIAFIEELQKKYPGNEVRLVLPERRVAVDCANIETEYLGIGAIRRRPVSALLRSVYRLAAGTARSARIMLTFRPDLVVGFGSLPTVPVVLSGWFMRRKTMIHEQNVVPGAANRLLAKFCDRVCVSFPETGSRLGIRGRTVVTGNPVRRFVQVGREEALRFFGFSRDSITVLVTGGSQGSSRINREFLAAISGDSLKGRFQVVHITGNADFESVKQGYERVGIHAAVYPFFSSMEYAYAAADIAVCRAGAATVTELGFFSIPAVLIPYPYAHGHQSANARVMEKNGCCVVIKDEELDARALETILAGVAAEPGRLERMRSGYARCVKADAARLLADEAASLVPGMSRTGKGST